MWKNLFVFALFASQMGATDCGSIIKDPGFDVWCGDSLCSWKVERGDIARAPTWHDKDSGVSFVGADVAIEQLTAVNDGDTHCVAFDMIADVEANAEVDLNIDLEGDGTVEKTESIPSAHWAPQHFLIAVGGSYDGIRFELVKHGDGKAVVAQIEATTADGQCDGLPAISVIAKRPDGGRCASGADCMSGRCNAQLLSAGRCVGCDGADGECTANEVCGIGAPEQSIFPVPFSCVATASKETGEPCFSAAECATNACVQGVCSTCAATSSGDTLGTCPAGVLCNPTFTTDGHDAPNAMFVCGGGTGTVASGQPCGADADCATHHCNGSVREQCDDGRACATRYNCPDATGLEPGPCTTVGIQGGTCQ